LRTHLLLLTLTPACSCVYICKFQFRPIHPPSRRLSLADVSTAKSLFIRCESDVWESLWSQWAALTEANERLTQRSAEVADLRLLCDELKLEAAAARTEAASARMEASSAQEQVAS
jgi:hypothetical protein